MTQYYISLSVSFVSCLYVISVNGWFTQANGLRSEQMDGVTLCRNAERRGNEVEKRERIITHPDGWICRQKKQRRTRGAYLTHFLWHLTFARESFVHWNIHNAIFLDSTSSFARRKLSGFTFEGWDTHVKLVNYQLPQTQNSSNYLLEMRHRRAHDRVDESSHVAKCSYKHLDLVPPQSTLLVSRRHLSLHDCSQPWWRSNPIINKLFPLILFHYASVLYENVFQAI